MGRVVAYITTQVTATVKAAAAWAPKTVTATTSAQRLDGGIAGRKSLAIVADKDNTAKVYVSDSENGLNADATRASLAPGQVLEMDITEAEQIWVKAASGSQVVGIVEVGDP